MNRPSWTNYFLGLASVVSRRSHDIHTQHGCVITDPQHRILGVGYNGFPHSLEDTQLPTSRPEKYSWIIHAERNALSNCVVRPDNGIAYVTGQCCNDCIMALWQEGIKTVFMTKRQGTILFDKGAKERFDLFIKMSGIRVEYVDADLSWLEQSRGVV